jgi:hypothetical protein
MIFACKTAKRKGVLAFYGNIWCVFWQILPQNGIFAKSII